MLHKIKAHLYANALTDLPNDYVARVNSERSLSIKDICESATTRGGADISADAMEHAVNLWLREMGYQLCDGFSINTGWFTASTHIRGVFDSPQETFNRNKHTVLFEFNQGAQLRKELENMTVEIQGVANTSLSIAQVVDMKTGSINDQITPGRNLKIIGHRLKIVGDSKNNGIAFIDQQSMKPDKVEISDIVVNNPSELIVVIPSILYPGTYKVEVTTQYATGKLLKEPRTVTFDKVLTVREEP